MSWQFAFYLFIIIASFSTIWMKIATNKLPQKAVAIFYQYLFCAGLTFLFLFTGKVELNPGIILIATIGFANAFANYFQWKALELSLSKTVLFFPLMPALAVGLAIIFLKEIEVWSPQLLIGLVLCLLAMWLFQSVRILNRKWFLFVLGLIIISGTSDFLIKLFSLSVSRETFLIGWYNGALLGTLPLLLLTRQKLTRISLKTILLILPLSLSLMGSLFVFYWVFQLGGIVSEVAPLKDFFLTAIPVLFGWFLFKERKGLSQKEWLGFLIGIIGALLILLR